LGHGGFIFWAAVILNEWVLILKQYGSLAVEADSGTVEALPGAMRSCLGVAEPFLKHKPLTWSNKNSLQMVGTNQRI
jgi:hypothetical protein